MATLSVSEKKNFRVTSESLFNNLLGKIVDHQVRLEAQNLIIRHKNKWPQLYHEQNNNWTLIRLLEGILLELTIYMRS